VDLPPHRPYEEALRLLEQALAISRRTQGPDHPATMANVQGLAAVYMSLGRTTRR
jgi:hypothetical protein